MNAATLLLVDDEKSTTHIIRENFKSDFRIIVAENADKASNYVSQYMPDVIICNVNISGWSGKNICQELRKDPRLTDIPIVFLASQATAEDVIKGFLAGADDFVSKPFNVDELKLRVKALLRRTSKARQVNEKSAEYRLAHPSEIQPERAGTEDREAPMDSELDKNGALLIVGEYVLNLKTFELQTPHRGIIRLTPIQFHILNFMMRNTGETFTPAQLFANVWKHTPHTGSPDLVRVHIKNLRQRIEEDPQEPTFIRTVSGFGYTIGESD
jgi:two-component system, OmpR family, response regulator RpaA